MLVIFISLKFRQTTNLGKSVVFIEVFVF